MPLPRSVLEHFHDSLDLRVWPTKGLTRYRTRGVKRSHRLVSAHPHGNTTPGLWGCVNDVAIAKVVDGNVVFELAVSEELVHEP